MPACPHADFGDQPLETFPILTRGARLAEVAVNHHDSLQRPAQRHRPLTQGVLTLRAFRVLEHLLQRRLPYVKTGVSFQVARLDFVLNVHCVGILAFHGIDFSDADRCGRSMHRILTEYFDYYHNSRGHLSLDRNSPIPRRVEPPSEGEAVATPQVGGLHHRYTRCTA